MEFTQKKLAKKKFVMYGAGSIGRGFIGPLFSHAGYEVIFVDINKTIIDALNTSGHYYYTIACKESYDTEVTGVCGIDGTNEQAVINEIVECDLMAVSLGSSVLQKVTPIIAKGFSLRMDQTGKPLNILICENLKDANVVLRDWLLEELPKEYHKLLKEKCGLIKTAIGRMVPVVVPNPFDPLNVLVEEYDFLPFDKDAFIGTLPKIDKLVPYSPFSFYEERKLYLHNMGHAICAFLGLEYGYEAIDQAIRDPYIRLLTLSAMIESSSMLSAKYGIPYNDIFDHAEDLLIRFGNTALGDTCERVGRDPMRKLNTDDRLAGIIRQCPDYGIHPVYISFGYAIALKRVTEDWEYACKICRETGNLTIEQTGLIMRLYDALSLTPQELIETIEAIKKELRGNTV